MTARTSWISMAGFRSSAMAAYSSLSCRIFWSVYNGHALGCGASSSLYEAHNFPLLIVQKRLINNKLEKTFFARQQRA